MSNLKEICKIECKQQRVRAVRYNVDGSYCMTCGADKKINLWNPYKKLLQQPIPPCSMNLEGEKGANVLLHVASQIIALPLFHGINVKPSGLLPTSLHSPTGSNFDGTEIVTLLKVYGGHAMEVLDAAGSCESSHIISASADKSLIYWDVATGQPLRRFRTHAASVTCVKFNEESTMAVSGSVDNTVMLWDLMSRRTEPVQVLKEARDTITSIVVNDHEILTSSVDCHLRLYDLRSCKMTSDFIGQIVTSVNMTNDGQCYVVSCQNDEIKLFDKDSGEQLSTYSGHSMRDYMIENCINNEDSFILSGSTTGEIFIWDLISGSCVDKLVHNNFRAVTSLSHHPKEPYLLSASDDNIKLWGAGITEEADGGPTVIS